MTRKIQGAFGFILAGLYWARHRRGNYWIEGRWR